MPPSGRPDARFWTLGLIGIALVTLWRVALLPFDRADLFVDDAQYWLWGQQLAWGYYSKPPLIAWVLRASTEIGGDGAFWLRLPLPLIHAGTALLVALTGRQMFGAATGGLAGLAFASLPAVAVGSLLVSTDTPMLFFFALAVMALLKLAERRSVGWALTLGVAVGLGLLSKYAMVYFVLCAGLGAALLPEARIAWRDAVLAVAVGVAIIAPNLAWNAANDFSTLQHTAENADWEGPRLDVAGLLRFFASQFAVAGPVLFAAYLAALPRAVRSPGLRFLAVMSVPVLAIVSVQALVSGANANWAAGAHLGALLLAIAFLQTRPRLLAAGLAINLAVTLALPLAATRADTLRIGGGGLLFARYVGRSEVSLRAERIARDAGLEVIVASDRSILADLFYTLRDSGLAIHAEPVAGFPPHHYAQEYPLPPGPGEVLYVTRAAAGPVCGAGSPAPVLVEAWQPVQGRSSKPVRAFRVDRTCWQPATGG